MSAPTLIHQMAASSPFGPLQIAATEKGICWLSVGKTRGALENAFPDTDILDDDGTAAPFFEPALRAVQDLRQPHDVPLDPQGTAFQRRVWAELRRIAPGTTTTYAAIAHRLGDPGAVRAVGRANGANPVALLIPCHRVIRSDGDLGGYAYGLDLKRRLLDSEGAIVAPVQQPLAFD